MTKEELLVLLEIATLYNLDYLETLSVEELENLYFEKVEHGRQSK